MAGDDGEWGDADGDGEKGDGDGEWGNDLEEVNGNGGEENPKLMVKNKRNGMHGGILMIVLPGAHGTTNLLDFLAPLMNGWLTFRQQNTCKNLTVLKAWRKRWPNMTPLLSLKRMKFLRKMKPLKSTRVTG